MLESMLAQQEHAGSAFVHSPSAGTFSSGTGSTPAQTTTAGTSVSGDLDASKESPFTAAFTNILAESDFQATVDLLVSNEPSFGVQSDQQRLEDILSSTGQPW